MAFFRTGCWPRAFRHSDASALLRATLSVLLIIASSQPLAAQDKLLPVIHFNRLSTADGLPSNQLRSNVVRDQWGFIWFGTVNGLVRYDGYSCKVYREFSVPDNVLMLYIDSRGRLWAGKYASSLSLYDPAKDRFVHFEGRHDDSLSFHPSYTQTIYEDPSGILWIGTEDAIVSLDLGSARDDTDAESVARHARFRTIHCDGFKGGSLKLERWGQIRNRTTPTPSTRARSSRMSCRAHHG